MNFWELNTYVDDFMTKVNVCVEKLREWRQGTKISILDLGKVYLQIH